jgi:two-component system response regulator TtrR
MPTEKKKIVVYSLSPEKEKDLEEELRISPFHLQFCQSVQDCLGRIDGGGVAALFIDTEAAPVPAFTLCMQVKKIHPAVSVVIMLPKGDVSSAVKAAQIGAHFICEKPLGRDQIRDILRSIGENALFQKTNLTDLLSEMERQIVRRIIAGQTNVRIAEALHRSVRTIEEHRSVIMKKLGVDNPVDLLNQSMRLGIIEPEQLHPDK